MYNCPYIPSVTWHSLNKKKTEEAQILATLERILDWDPHVKGGLDWLMPHGATEPTHYSSHTSSSGTEDLHLLLKLEKIGKSESFSGKIIP